MVQMHIEFLVEELSVEAALNNLIPRILGEECSYRIHPYRGKSDLLSSLRARLIGYSKWLPDDWRIVVLMDEDRDDCLALKNQLEQAARNAGLITKSQASAGANYQVVNRLAIEELEAWFLGDTQALTAAYPRVSPSFTGKARFRDPDAVVGGTWEALERLLQTAGQYPSGLPKIETARRISQYMDPQRNRSHSFQVFRDSLRGLL